MSKKMLITTCVLWGGAFILFLAYSYWGQSLISDMYHERSVLFLNNLLNGREIHSLEFYITKANRTIFGIIICILLLSFNVLGYTYLKNPVKKLIEKSGLIEWSKHHPNLLVLFALVLISILFRLPYFFRTTIGLDEATFLLVGQSMVEGNLPYTELWDLKPPLAFVPFAMSIWLFGKSIIAIRIVGAVCLGIAAYFTYRTGTHIWGRQAGFIAALMSIIFVSIIANGQATSPEIMVTVPLMWALTLLITRDITTKTSFQVGLLLSVAVLIRMNLAYLVILVGIYLCAFPIFIQKRWSTKYIVMYGIGGLIPLIIVILPYAIEKQLGTLFTSLVVLPLQYSNSQQSIIESLKFILMDTKFFGIYNVLLWFGFLGGIIMVAKHWSHYTSEQKFKIFLVTIFTLGVALSILNNGLVGYHHLIQIVALLALPASLFYSALIRHRYKIIMVAVFTLALIISSHKILNSYSGLASKIINNKPLSNDASNRLAAYLRKENPTNKPMYLTIYHVALWLNDAKPLIKHLTHPDNLGRPYMLKILVDKDATTKSELIKILNKKPLFIVKDESINFIRQDPDAINIFNDTLQTDYLFVEQFGKAHVYKRK